MNFHEKLLTKAIVRADELRERITSLKKEISTTAQPSKILGLELQICYAQEWLAFNEWIILHNGEVEYSHYAGYEGKKRWQRV